MMVEDNSILFESLGITLQEKLLDIPVLITADRIRIAQVINNLLQNAAKFSFLGGTTRIEVKLAKESAQVIIAIRDDGVGIDSELLQHLFEPFIQSDRTLNRSKGGLGLGLLLVKGLIELHGGTVQVFSAGKDQGAEFIIKLPLEQATQSIEKIEIVQTQSKIRQTVLII